MKPPQFRYYRARSLTEALDLLKGAGAGGKLLAGGQSLVPLLNLRLASPPAVIDINSIRDLAYIQRIEGEVRIGALTRHREMEFSGLIARELPLLAAAVPQIGHPAIRNRGTLGGSLAQADPAAELPCVLAALNATLIVAGPSGERAVGAEEFFLGYYTTALAEEEVLKEVRIPLQENPPGWSFVEFARRHGDFALAESAVIVSAKNSAGAARVVVGGSVERPVRISSVERLISHEILTKKSLGQSLLNEIKRLTLTELQTTAALRDNSNYTTNLTAVLVGRAVKEAYERWSQR